jgi:hypothetical protein
MRDIALLGIVSLMLTFVAASAETSLRHCAAGQACAARPAMSEGRDAFVAEYQTSQAFVGRGADRGHSMYFSPQQDEAYDGRMIGR